MLPLLAALAPGLFGAAAGGGAAAAGGAGAAAGGAGGMAAAAPYMQMAGGMMGGGGQKGPSLLEQANMASIQAAAPGAAAAQSQPQTTGPVAPVGATYAPPGGGMLSPDTWRQWANPAPAAATAPEPYTMGNGAGGYGLF